MSEITLIDYPGHVSALIHTMGCKMRCPYCYNLGLLRYKRMDFKPIFDKIVKNDIIDAVVITGGEPTIQPNLPEFIRDLHSIGLSIKLDTNGSMPSVLRHVSYYVDYVAMDVKTDLRGYKYWLKTDPVPIVESIQLIMEEFKDYEFRCTAMWPFLSSQTVDGIGFLCRNASNFFIQEAKSDVPLLDESICMFPLEEVAMRGYAIDLRKYINRVEIR